MTLVRDGLVTHLMWRGDALRYLDQTLLPGQVRFEETSDYRDVCDAIRRLAIRGAPAIGVAAGYALVLGAKSLDTDDPDRFGEEVRAIGREIGACRPTAVNLSRALKRLFPRIEGVSSVSDAIQRLEREAKAIHREDVDMCRKLSRLGKDLLPESGGVMTHCNTGGLATGGYGTALGVIHAAASSARRSGKPIGFKVIVNETRPLFQGSRLTAWELQQAGIPFVLMTDSMSGQAFSRGMVNCVIVGADRIAANGDTANKIGTYSLAVLARYHEVPFYVAAPTSTLDGGSSSGNEIVIEERNGGEITHPFGVPVAPERIEVSNPAFDITPGRLITAIITEKGIISPPFRETIETIL